MLLYYKGFCDNEVEVYYYLYRENVNDDILYYFLDNFNYSLND